MSGMAAGGEFMGMLGEDHGWDSCYGGSVRGRCYVYSGLGIGLVVSDWVLGA